MSYIQFVKATQAWLALFQKIYTNQDSWITKEYQQAQQDHTYKLGKQPSNTLKLEKDQTWLKALPSQPNLFLQVPKTRKIAP